jgi:hypothetical protein
MRHVIFFLACLVFLSGCSKKNNPKPGRAFYCWRTSFSLNGEERKALADHRVNKLYLHFFDVAWDEKKRQALPVGVLYHLEPVPAGLEIAPVVYITTKALSNTPLKAIDTLSKNIMDKVQRMSKRHKIHWTELQLDCDWTDNTRDKYFQLLTRLKAGLESAQFLSATIRLHQVKYRERAGVPPVSRGMLMFYNMGKIGEKENSIFDPGKAAGYTRRIKNYPMPLDVALPVFGWAIQMREGKIVGLLNKVGTVDLLSNPAFEKLDETHFRAKRSFYMLGEYVKENDILQVEEIGPRQLEKAAEMVTENLKAEKRTVALFDLDSINLSRFENEDIAEAYSAFE